MTEEEKKAKNRELVKKWNKENKEKRKKYMREWHKNHREETNKYMREKYRSVVNKGRVFYGYNPCKLAHDYYQKINPETRTFSPTIANSKMSLETYLAMRAVFDPSTIQSLMLQLYHGSIEIEEINDMISAAGFDMNSEKFKKLINCINENKSEYSFYKNYNGEIFS